MLTHEILPNRRALRVYPKPGLICFEETATQSVASVVAGKSNDGEDCYKTRMLHLMEDYGKETTIHGLNHVFASKQSKIKRFAWTLIFVVGLSSLIYVCMFLANRHSQRLFKTTVESTRYPIYKIAFPEVTLCNENRLNWARLEVAKRRFLRPQHRYNEYEQLFTDVVSLYDRLNIDKVYVFEELAHRPLAKLNYINFTSVVGLMAWRCDEFLANCTWKSMEVSCCDVFIPRYSPLGLCWAFNSIESAQGAVKQFLDPKWPWRASLPGAGNGLTVRALINEHKHSPFNRGAMKGLTVMVVQPRVWYSYPFQLSSNTRANMRLGAILSFYDEQTRHLPTLVRRCVFKDERHSEFFKTLQDHKYAHENCLSQCQQMHVMRFCNCTIDLFFPPGPYRPCQLVDMPCVANYSYVVVHVDVDGKEEFETNKKRGIGCRCFLNCRSLRYEMDVRTRALRPEERLENESLIDMDFYFRHDTIMVFKTSLVYTWVDLMVSVGGGAALFLGCSLISLVELVYFFFVDMPQQVRENHPKPEKRTKGNKSVKRGWESVVATSKRKAKKMLKN